MVQSQMLRSKDLLYCITFFPRETRGGSSPAPAMELP